MHFWLIVILIILLFISIIAGQNITPIVIRFFSWQTPPLPLAAVIISVFLLGIIFSFLLNAGKIIKLTRRIKKLEGEKNK